MTQNELHYLTLPGLNGSGGNHWQSLWEKQLPDCRRVMQADWDTPVLEDWIAVLEQTITASKHPICLIAHSLSCALVTQWAKVSSEVTRVHSALLVAPADVDDPAHVPEVALGFGPMPLDPLPFATTVVAGDDDPFVTPARANAFASAWGADFRILQKVGHLNDTSGLGDWPEGRDILATLTARTITRQETGT